MAMSEQELRDLLLTVFPDASVRIEDLAGDGEHYRAVIRTSAFAGMNRIQQHKAVYAALGGRAGTVLHALALDTGVPDPI